MVIISGPAVALMMIILVETPVSPWHLRQYIDSGVPLPYALTPRNPWILGPLAPSLRQSMPLNNLNCPRDLGHASSYLYKNSKYIWRLFPFGAVGGTLL